MILKLNKKEGEKLKTFQKMHPKNRTASVQL